MKIFLKIPGVELLRERERRSDREPERCGEGERRAEVERRAEPERLRERERLGERRRLPPLSSESSINLIRRPLISFPK